MNGSTIGEYLGWRLANLFCSLQVMVEHDPDFDPGSAHVQRMLRFADDLRTVLWPEVYLDVGNDLPLVYDQALRQLCDAPGRLAPGGESLREGVVLLRAERGLLREPPPGLGNAANLPHVARRLQILLADGELPTVALACHIEGGGREASDGLRTPLQTEQWTLREYAARIFHTLANDLRRPGPRDQFIARVDAGDAAASLLLHAWQRRPDREAGIHTPTTEDIALACARLSEGLGPRYETAATLATPIERLRVYAAFDGWPLADVLELPAVGRRPLRESDADLNARARRREWKAELAQATEIKINRGKPFSMKIGPRVTSPDFQEYPPPKSGW